MGTLTVVSACGGGTGLEASPCEAGAIALGEQVSGSLDQSDCVQGRVEQIGEPGDRHEWWTFELSTPATVVIDAELVSGAEVRVSVSVPGSSPVAGGSAGLWSYPLDVEVARIVESLAPGSYFIDVRTRASRAASYVLAVEMANDCTPIGTLSVGDTLIGELGPTDCPLRTGTVSDRWLVSRPPNDDFCVVLRSQAFSPVMAGEFEDGTSLNFLHGLVLPPPNEITANPSVANDPNLYQLIVAPAYRDAMGSYELLASSSAACGTGPLLSLGRPDHVSAAGPSVSASVSPSGP